MTKDGDAIAGRDAWLAFPDRPGTHAEWRRTVGDRWSLDLVRRDGVTLARDRRRYYSRRITVGEQVFAERHEGRRLLTSRLREVIDVENGAPIFRIEGQHRHQRARFVIHLPDGRKYSFPVQGRHQYVAVMTAMDEAGTAVAQFRRVSVPSTRLGKWNAHPKDEVLLEGDQPVSSELLCAIAVARTELWSYFFSAGA